MTDGAPMHMRKKLIADRPLPTLADSERCHESRFFLNTIFGGHEENKNLRDILILTCHAKFHILQTEMRKLNQCDMHIKE